MGEKGFGNLDLSEYLLNPNDIPPLNYCDFKSFSFKQNGHNKIGSKVS